MFALQNSNSTATRRASKEPLVFAELMATFMRWYVSALEVDDATRLVLMNIVLRRGYAKETTARRARTEETKVMGRLL